jgi:putative transposase
MSVDEEERRRERAEKVAYWRYQLIRDAADPGLSTRVRGRLVRALAGTVHIGPFGTQVRVSRPTLDRWIRAWRRGGFDALLPPRRQVSARTPQEVLDLAAALKREQPDRTAAQIVRILRAHSGWAPSERTLLRHFDRLELATRPGGHPPQAFGRFEAAAPNDRWVGDALHGPVIAGRKTYLIVTWNLAERPNVTDRSERGLWLLGIWANRSNVTDRLEPSRPALTLSCGQRAVGGEVAGPEPACSGVRVAAGMG